MSDSDRVVSAIAALISANAANLGVQTSAYNNNLIVATGATVTVSPGPARLACIYALSSITGTVSVQGFSDQSGSACSLTFASALSGHIFNPAVPVYVASIAVNTNTAADARKLLFIWKSA
jgi:hypothetical protein